MINQSTFTSRRIAIGFAVIMSFGAYIFIAQWNQGTDSTDEVAEVVDAPQLAPAPSMEPTPEAMADDMVADDAEDADDADLIDPATGEDPTPPDNGSDDSGFAEGGDATMPTPR